MPQQAHAARARRDEPSCPAWSSDHLESPDGPEIEAPYFDEILEAWVLSRHADVLAAFRSPNLTPVGPNSGKHPQSADPGQRLRMREETLDALSPALLNTWRDRLAPEVQALVAGLPVESPVDLIAGYARPLCLVCASIVTDLERDEAWRLQEHAQQVAAAAADPCDPVLRANAKFAGVGLQACFHSGPETLRDSGFVALSQTMIGILGNAWFALLQYPSQWHRLHRQPELMDAAIEELLRYAGLVRVIFRLATEDISLNGVQIRRGDRLVLRIIAANRDPERFTHANRVDITRRGAGHLTLGAGAHSCVGASLIRMAAVAITLPLLKRFANANLSLPPDWHGGPIYRYPSSLLVRLSDA